MFLGLVVTTLINKNSWFLIFGFTRGSICWEFSVASSHDWTGDSFCSILQCWLNKQWYNPPASTSLPTSCFIFGPKASEGIRSNSNWLYRIILPVVGHSSKSSRFLFYNAFVTGFGEYLDGLRANLVEVPSCFGLWHFCDIFCTNVSFSSFVVGLSFSLLGLLNFFPWTFLFDWLLFLTSFSFDLDWALAFDILSCIFASNWFPLSSLSLASDMPRIGATLLCSLLLLSVLSMHFLSSSSLMSTIWMSTGMACPLLALVDVLSLFPWCYCLSLPFTALPFIALLLASSSFLVLFSLHFYWFFCCINTFCSSSQLGQVASFVLFLLCRAVCLG